MPAEKQPIYREVAVGKKYITGPQTDEQKWAYEIEQAQKQERSNQIVRESATIAQGQAGNIAEPKIDTDTENFKLDELPEDTANQVVQLSDDINADRNPVRGDSPIVGDRVPEAEKSVIAHIPSEHDLVFKVPNWGYDDFIQERQAWVKGINSISGDPGLFYFKIFFDFDTANGLFGGSITSENGESKVGDCALRYFDMNIASKHYSMVPLIDKQASLIKFISSLSFISSQTPWFFDSISGLDKAITPSLTKPMEQKFIEIGCREDAVDMRVTTLMDLYRYAAYDYVNLKEVLPQNLRQFNMTICLFHTPIRWVDTATDTTATGFSKSYKYRRMNGYGEFANGKNKKTMDNTMSYKMITLKGCEFDVDSVGNMIPSSISDERGFQLAKSKIKITFKRSYTHSFNSWGAFIIGDDGLYYDKEDREQSSLSKVLGAVSNLMEAASGQDLYDESANMSDGRLYNIGKALHDNYNGARSIIDATEKNITGFMHHINAGQVVGNVLNSMI